MNPDQTLSMEMLSCHLQECGVLLLKANQTIDMDSILTHCVIRATDGDHALAAVHREGEVLVFDLGHPLRETEQAQEGAKFSPGTIKGP